MEIEINITKSVEQNAEEYYAKIKKFKKKLNGVKEAIERTDKRLEKAQKDSRVVKEEKVVVKRKEKWYEKFRWFRAGPNSNRRTVSASRPPMVIVPLSLTARLSLVVHVRWRFPVFPMMTRD